MATKPTETHYFSARSSDASRAMRDEYLALASLASGIVAATGESERTGKLSELDLYALRQAAAYFHKRAEDAKKGVSPANMAAMGAARQLAILSGPKGANGEALKLFEDLSIKLAALADDPTEAKTSKYLHSLFSDLAEHLRAAARSLVYEDLQTEKLAR